MKKKFYTCVEVEKSERPQTAMDDDRWREFFSFYGKQR